VESLRSWLGRLGNQEVEACGGDDGHRLHAALREHGGMTPFLLGDQLGYRVRADAEDATHVAGDDPLATTLGEHMDRTGLTAGGLEGDGGGRLEAGGRHDGCGSPRATR